MLGLGDDQIAAAAENGDGLSFNEPPVGGVIEDLPGDGSFGFGDDLVSDHDHVSPFQRDSGRRQCTADELGKVVALGNIADAMNRDELHGHSSSANQLPKSRAAAASMKRVSRTCTPTPRSVSLPRSAASDRSMIRSEINPS